MFEQIEIHLREKHLLIQVKNTFSNLIFFLSIDKKIDLNISIHQNLGHIFMIKLDCNILFQHASTVWNHIFKAIRSVFIKLFKKSDNIKYTHHERMC